MRHKRSSIAIALAAGLALSSATFVARQGTPQSVKDEVELQRAIETETVRGDLNGAIEQYKKVSQSKDHTIAVKALLRMADLYQRVGNTEAQKTYERIVRDFPDQAEAASLARNKLIFEITVPLGPDPFNISVSPDGQKMAYVAWANPSERFGVSVPDDRLSSSRAGVWVRSLDSADDRILPGTEGTKWESSPPFWSPDSRFIAFVICGPARGRNPDCEGSDGIRLRKVALAGGPVQQIAVFPRDVGAMRRGTWNRDGVILIAPTDWIRKLSASGGPVSDATSLDRALQETVHSSPWFLPDNQHFLFRVLSDKPENAGVFVGSLASSSRTRLLDVSSRASYSQGFLLFVRPTKPGVSTLFAQPFNADRLQLTGEAVAVADDVLYDPNLGIAGFDVNAIGTLIYRTSSPEALAAWRTRTPPPYAYVGNASSPVKVIRNWTLLLKR